MRFPTRVLLITTLLGGAASAQCPPGFSRGPARSKCFDALKPPFKGVGTTAISQVSARQLDSNRPGEYEVGLTISRVSARYGGNGRSQGIVMARFYPNQGICYPTTLANALNSADHEFGLHIEPGRGRYAVFDRFKAPNFAPFLGIFFASRKSANDPFGAPVKIANVQGLALGYGDPSLGPLGGKLMLFYSGRINGQNGIYIDELDVSNPQAPRVKGQPKLVVKPILDQPHSSFPLIGPDGDTEGLWHGDFKGNNSDMFFSNDLDPNTPAVLVWANKAWQNNGCVTGGLFHSANTAFRFNQTQEGEGAWLLGDVESIGGRVDVFGGAFNNAPPAPVVTVVFMSAKLGAPLSLPGIFGKFCLDGTTARVLGAMLHDPVTQMAKMAIPIPNDRVFQGLRLPIQGVALQSAKKIFTFTNNAWITIRP